MTFDPSRPGGPPPNAAHRHDPAQAFEDKETIQRMDVPEAAHYVEQQRALRAAQAPPRSGLLIDWLLPLALGLLAALVLAVLTWLVVIE